MHDCERYACADMRGRLRAPFVAVVASAAAMTGCIPFTEGNPPEVCDPTAPRPLSVEARPDVLCVGNSAELKAMLGTNYPCEQTREDVTSRTTFRVESGSDRIKLTGNRVLATAPGTAQVSAAASGASQLGLATIDVRECPLIGTTDAGIDSAADAPDDG
jgi:hypothetical protein